MVGLRKTIAELSFSPASVEEIAVQARRIRRQQHLLGWALLPLSLLVVATAIIMFSRPAAPIDPAAAPQNAAFTNPQLEASLKVDQSQVAGGDTVNWQLTVTNQSDQPQTDDIYFTTDDISDYAYIARVSNDGIAHEREHYVTWPDLTVAANSRIDLLVTTRMSNPVPTRALEPGRPTRHDCVLSSTFGNTVNVNVNCSPLKQLELILQSGPQLPQAFGLGFSLILLSAALIGYLSLRLQSKELRIIRRQLNTGSLI